MHFRNTTKILQHKVLTLKLLFIFTLSLLLKVSFPQTMIFSCIFCFCFFSHSYGSFNHDIFNILDPLWVSCTLFIHIFTLFIHRKSFCTFICQVAPLTSSCLFSTFHPCSLLPQASLSFIWHPFIKLHQASLGFLLRTSSDWSKGFTSCYHSKMGKHT